MSADEVAVLQQEGGLKVEGQKGKRDGGGGTRAGGGGGEDDVLFVCEICARSFSSLMVRLGFRV
jgi:hypothetical protein